MNQTNTTSTVDMLRGLIGRQVESKTGVLLINDVLTHKTGVLKDGSSAPYLHLIAEMGDRPEVDLHPQKAMELLKKGESGAYKILGELAADATVAPATVEIIGEVIAEGKPASELIADLSVPAVAVAAAALGMTVEQVAEGAASAGEQGAQAAEGEKKESKKAGTLRIYAAGIAAGLARKDIIAKMRTELDLSVPGANTYYQNCKSGMWK